ncbi:transcriptional attenuator, LytR family [Blastococcus aggregatus]|uniref:Transcriptional attenuator, LytR family n=1 Tax=Blastococcus aggregatus TaxID=38502 RepID=A0A285VDC1_9ACTN|nr:LCP family protein [Blastococcus aggregatus]SOC52099.1 transcriptional attenuator, LytR family [Blastococcus aggregatus]
MSGSPSVDLGARRRAGSFRAALGWTVLNALLPGTAFLVVGRRVLGGVVLGGFLLLAAGGAWVATGGQRSAVRASVDTSSLLWIVAGVGVGALLWCAVVVAGYLLLLPRGTSRGRRLLGGGVVFLLVAAVLAPAVGAGRVALTQRDLIAEVFTDDGRSATVDEDDPNPFGSQERVNVLLLGGDGGEGREGVRTDTVIVASIDTDDGATTLFSLPRNLEDLPFPESSPLADLYPDGFDAGSESESLLNAVYRNGPAMYPDALGPTDNAGADFLKLGVGEALGIEIDYYVLVNLEGFSRLVDALGGITVDVNYWVPIGGEPSLGTLPDDYIAPGPNRFMDGATALAFARGRFGLTDYDRMDRQRCTLDAIVDAADPMTLLRKYQQLARTTKDIVSTDIPRSVLGDFVDLAFLVKDAGIRSVVFDDSVIDPAYPDYDKIRGAVYLALSGPDGGSDPDGSDPDGSEPDGGAPGDDAADGTDEPTPAAPTPSTGGEEPEGSVAPSDVRDACAYDREAAELALQEGEPPTRGD